MSSDAMWFEHLDILRCYVGKRVKIPRFICRTPTSIHRYSEDKACAHGKRSGTQENEEMLQDLERPLEVPKVGDMFRSTPASEDLCQRDLPKAQE